MSTQGISSTDKLCRLYNNLVFSHFTPSSHTSLCPYLNIFTYVGSRRWAQINSRFAQLKFNVVVAWHINHQSAVFFSQKKSVINNQPTTFFSRNKSKSVTSQTNRLQVSENLVSADFCLCSKRTLRKNSTVSNAHLLFLTSTDLLGNFIPGLRFCVSSFHENFVSFSYRVLWEVLWSIQRKKWNHIATKLLPWTRVKKTGQNRSVTVVTSLTGSDRLRYRQIFLPWPTVKPEPSSNRLILPVYLFGLTSTDNRCYFDKKPCLELHFIVVKYSDTSINSCKYYIF